MLVSGIIGYVICALICYLLVVTLSSNAHDREMEAVMTAVFIMGPLGGFIASTVAAVRTRR